MQAKERGVLWWWGWEGALYLYNTRYGPEWALYLYSIYIDSTSTYITRGMDESGRTCCHLFNSTTLRPACAALIRNKMKSKYGRDFICSQKLKPFSQVIPGGACPGNDWITDKLEYWKVWFLATPVALYWSVSSWAEFWVFSCPEQLNRWPCHSLTHSLSHLLILEHKTIHCLELMTSHWLEQDIWDIFW